MESSWHYCIEALGSRLSLSWESSTKIAEYFKRFAKTK